MLSLCITFITPKFPIMKHFLKHLYVTVLLLAATIQLSAQVQVRQADIALTGVNLRLPSALVLQSLPFPAHLAGTFVVRFDGTCYADSGDRMVMAASHDRNYGANDGNVGVEVANAATQSRSFSHTRIYTLGAGTDTFFAVGQNWVDENGSGMASVYGSLTVEFWPATGPAVGSSDMIWSGNLAGPQQRMDSIVAPTAPAGKVFLHMDGQAVSDPGDRIVATANNAPSWLVGAGSVAFMAYSNSQIISPYTHSRVRNVSNNPNTFYAMAANVVDQGGSGNASFYGNLSAEFFPAGGPATVDQAELSYQNLNVRAGTLAMDSVTITASAPGYALVILDGYITSDAGDDIVLAASNDGHWHVDAGNVTVQALSHDNPFSVFSHSRLYPVAPGTHTFYAVAQNIMGTAGSGTIDINANLTVKYFSDAGVGIDEAKAQSPFTIYPNPADGYVLIHSTAAAAGSDISLQDLSGRIVQVQQVYGPDTRLDIACLPAGMYLVHMSDHVCKLVKQ